MGIGKIAGLIGLLGATWLQQVDSGKLSLIESAKQELTHFYPRGNDFQDVRTGREYLIPMSVMNEQEQWVRKALEDSRKNDDYLIVVSKLERRLDIFYDGELVDRFPVALGLKVFEDKLYERDRRTPEGVYKIVQKKDGVNIPTDYYKALLIDYPDLDDKRRFVENKEKGLIPNSVSGPGSLIEIHGQVPQWRNFDTRWDWTSGCVGMMDRDIDFLFSKVNEGTFVVIVKAYHQGIRNQYKR